MTEAQVVQGVIIVTGVIEKEGNQYVARCRELGTSTCASSIEEAFEELEDAIEVHLNALEEHGEIDTYLRERNINITIDPLDELLLAVPLGKPMRTYQLPVPIAASA